MPDCDGPAVMFTGKMAAAGLKVVEETPLAAKTARCGWGRQRCQLHRELESVKVLVWAPQQEWQGGCPQTSSPRPKLSGGRQAGKTLKGWRR